MLQWVKCLLRERKDLSSDPLHPCKELGVMIHNSNASSVDADNEDPWGFLEKKETGELQVSLETLPQKNDMESNQPTKTLGIDLWILQKHPRMCTYAQTHFAHMHEHIHAVHYTQLFQELSNMSSL